jgi:tetratricopeptide (TPR) repeat protein
MQRFLERHAHAFLWVISIGLLLLLALVAARHGAMGEPVQVKVRNVETAVDTFITANAQSFDYGTKVIGALVTVLTAVIGIVKGIHYSERRLPVRLADFATRTLRSIEGHAEAMVAAVAAPTVITKPGAPLFFVGPLNRALDDIGAPTTRGVPRGHKEVVADLDASITLAETQLDTLKALRANALLSRGAATTAKASYDAADGIEPRPAHLAAEDDFEEATKHESARVHAFELRGLLRARQGNFAGALSDFEEMLEAAPDDWITPARAQRYIAETLLKQSNGTSAAKLREARRQLNSAWNTFPHGKTSTLKERQELARNRLGYADLLPLLNGTADNIRRTLESGRHCLVDGARMVDQQLADQIHSRLKELDRDA